MSEEGKVESAPNVDQFLTAGVSVRKAPGIAEVHADDVTPRDPAQLGASGLASSMRSPVTKSFRSGRQGGFDAAGDDTAGLDQVAPLTSSRPGSMVAIISNALGEDADEENLKHFFCVPITNNVKALFVMMCMFAAISLGQYFAAEAANSQSLKADVSFVFVAAVCFVCSCCHRVVSMCVLILLPIILCLRFPPPSCGGFQFQFQTTGRVDGRRRTQLLG